MLSFQARNVAEWERRHAVLKAEVSRLKSRTAGTVKKGPRERGFIDTTEETIASREKSLRTLARLIEKHSPQM